jgi:transaldolase
VVGVLEEEGVQKFAASWHELLSTIESEMAAANS